MPIWSLNPLLHSRLSAEEMQVILADPKLAWHVLLVLLLLGVSYPLVHRMLLRYLEEYKKIGSDAPSKQVVILHHAVEALVLTFITPVFSYYIMIILFQEHDIHEVTSYFRKLTYLLGCIVAMYMVELASRFEDPRKVILLHHLLTMLDAILACSLATETMLKTAIILSYFVCFEAVTFIGLVMYRILPNSNVTQKMIVSGMICFGITRPFQLLGIGSFIIVSWNDENFVKWQAILQLGVTLILSSLQVWSLKIHHQIWIRCVARQKEFTKAKVDTETELQARCLSRVGSGNTDRTEISLETA